MDFPKVVFVIGPTGVGKSKLGIEIAKQFEGEVISMDSMQVYKSLDILTNKVTAEETEDIPHHMLSIGSWGFHAHQADFEMGFEFKNFCRGAWKPYQ